MRPGIPKGGVHMTHNMKAFIELAGEDRELAARVQMLMLGDGGRCSAVTQAAIIRLAAEHGLELRSSDLDYAAPDLSNRTGTRGAACHCFMSGSGTAERSTSCECVMYGSGYSGPSRRSRNCSCTSLGMGI